MCDNFCLLIKDMEVKVIATQHDAMKNYRGITIFIKQ